LLRRGARQKGSSYSLDAPRVKFSGKIGAGLTGGVFFDIF
jgi:hypothetical protein